MGRGGQAGGYEQAYHAPTGECRLNAVKASFFRMIYIRKQWSRTCKRQNDLSVVSPEKRQRLQACRIKHKHGVAPCTFRHLKDIKQTSDKNLCMLSFAAEPSLKNQ